MPTFALQKHVDTSVTVSNARACKLFNSRAQDLVIAPTGPNTVWSMDFMHDRLMGDRRQPFRVLTSVDIVTREYLGLEVASGFRAGDVVHVLSRIVAQRGAPVAIRCDQGTEFTGEALDQWAYANKIELDFSRPGKPTDNVRPRVHRRLQPPF